MARITEIGEITGVREGTTGYTAAELNAMAEAERKGDSVVEKLTDREARDYVALKEVRDDVKLDDAPIFTSEDIMKQSRAEKLSPKEGRELREALRGVCGEGETRLREVADTFFAGKRSTERAEAALRRAGYTSEDTPGAKAKGRKAFIAEASARIMEQLGHEVTETDRAELTEAAEKYVPNAPRKMPTREERKAFVAKATENILEMAGCGDEERRGRKPNESFVESATADMLKQAGRIGDDAKGDFVAEATKRILEEAGK